ncbi:VWA domain-containing protein [Candidatus Poribacteria bacterium]|nr:VWA domain-containing protein [Candidatus Poribacteria bacterium]
MTETSSRVTRKRQKAAVVAWLLFVILPVFSWNRAYSYAAQDIWPSSEEDSRLSIVFVIDVSTSMYDILDGLKEALKEYVRELRTGDSIAIVTFGKYSKLHYRTTIRASSDVEKLLEFCDALSCPDEYTYIPHGLNTGVRELYRFFQENPNGRHMLVVMSDGRNNPPKDIDEKSVVTYDGIKNKFFSKFEPGDNWYISYVALRGASDLELADFVQTECHGNKIELHLDQLRGKTGAPPLICEARIQLGANVRVGSDRIINFGSACVPIKVDIPLLITPLRGKPEGQPIKINPILTDALATSKLTAKVTPSEIVCGATPTKASVAFSINGEWEEEINGSLLLEPVGHTIFIVHPLQLLFKFEKPPKINVGRYNTAVKGSPWEEIDRLTLGPLKPGGKVEEKLVLRLDGGVPSEGMEIQTTPDIKLPEGIVCTSSAELKLNRLLGSEAVISISAEANEGSSLPIGWKVDGNLVLKSPGGVAKFFPNPIPIRVFTSEAGENSGWAAGKGAPSRELRPWEWTKQNSRLILFGITLPALFGGSIMFFGIARWKAYMNRFLPLEGWLMVVEKPQGMNLKNIELKPLSERLKKSKLIFGSEPFSDIAIPHKSVDKQHAQVRSGREGTPAPVYIRSLGMNDVNVNGAVIDEEVKLGDRDIIKIGDVQFVYSNSPLKQVVVHYKDGDVRYGIPLTWNIEEDGFLLRPEGKGATELQMYIPFKDLKAVFFVKSFDKEIAKKIDWSSIYAKKDHLIVEFLDGEELDGYTIQDYNPNASRFFVVPGTESGKEENNICVLVERLFTRKIKVVSKQT